MLVLLSTRDPDPILTPFIPIFFLLNWRDFHEHFQLEISSKCDIKAENSSTLCKFHKRTKGLRVRPMGSNTDLDSFVHSCCWSRHFFFYDRGRLGRVEIVTLGDPVGNPLGTLWVGVREKEGKRGGGVFDSHHFLPSSGVSTWRFAGSTIRAPEENAYTAGSGMLL